MAEYTTNSTDNVSAIKGVKGGYIFSAPIGTMLPTDYTTELDPAFKVLGFISEDGFAESREKETENVVDMNGDLMYTSITSVVESAQFTLAEIKAETLKVQYGENNVTDENGLISVQHNSNDATERSYVLELLLKDDRRFRRVIPRGQSTALDTLTMAAGELGARALTMNYLTDSAGNTCYGYIQSTETEAAVEP